MEDLAINVNKKAMATSVTVLVAVAVSAEHSLDLSPERPQKAWVVLTDSGDLALNEGSKRKPWPTCSMRRTRNNPRSRRRTRNSRTQRTPSKFYPNPKAMPQKPKENPKPSAKLASLAPTRLHTHETSDKSDHSCVAQTQGKSRKALTRAVISSPRSQNERE